MTKHIAVGLFLVLSPFSLHGADIHGLRFRCNDLSSREICLRVLASGCRLEVQQGKSLPPEAEERITLAVAQNTSTVHSPKDLVGCVEINSEDDALEYLRFFSSLWTVHWFESSKLEIFSGRCLRTCLYDRDWRALRLKKASVTRREDAFEVRRVVARRGAERWPLEVSEIVERVSRVGAVEELSSRVLDIPMRIRGRLNFPIYQ